MENLRLFVDGSVDVKQKVGYGAHLFTGIEEEQPDNLKSKIVIKRFEDTSSTKLEIENLLYALQTLDDGVNKIEVFTDSQNIISLLDRRERLERNGYSSGKHEQIANAYLYKQFYKLLDALNCTFVKIKGHKPSIEKNYIDRVFSLVDKAARKALRSKL